MSRGLLFVDLPKYCGVVVDCFVPPIQQSGRRERNLSGKRQLRSWSKADRYARVFRCRKPARASAEVARRQLVANFGRPRFDALKAEVAHLGTPLLGCPSARSSLTLLLPLLHQPESEEILRCCD